MQKPILFTGIAAAVILVGAIAFFAFRGGNTSAISQMAQSGQDEAAMIAAIEKSSSPYKLSADDVIKLKNDGVPDTVVVRMLQHKR